MNNTYTPEEINLLLNEGFTLEELTVPNPNLAYDGPCLDPENDPRNHQK